MLADSGTPVLDTATWRAQAACAGDPSPEAFFAVGESGSADTARVKSLCAACPVRADCLLYAVETAQTFGVWGGLDADERRLIRRRWLTTSRRDGFAEARRVMVVEELPRVLSTQDSRT